MTSLRHDFITSRRSIWMESMPVCLLHVSHNRTKNMVTAVVINRDFCQTVFRAAILTDPTVLIFHVNV